MKKLVLAVAALAAAMIVGPAAARTEQGPGVERLLIGFAGAPGASERAAVARAGGEVLRVLPESGAIAVRMNPNAAQQLVARGVAAYVEPDELRFPLGLETEQAKPTLSNGLYGLLTTRSTNVHARGKTGAGIRACVADTGLDYTHPDIAANYKGGIDEVSNDFDPWWNNDPNEAHGTHVAGTVVGVNNTVGVYGVAYASELYYARVLGPNGGYSSDIQAGVRWLVEQKGCKVVNLSLGGGRAMKTEERFYNSMDSKGALIVAATGNDSATRISYPAGYTSVLSVGAVDVNNVHASFSNTGTGIDISAPGVLVLSSVPGGTGSAASVTAGSEHRAFGLEFAGRTSGTSGVLVDCKLGQVGECPATVSGNVALIKRGSISFGDKVKNAQNAGAVAAIIYNNAPEDFTGTLGSAGSWIPAVSVSGTTGTALMAKLGTTAAVVNVPSNWDHYDGTSMATPHVSGVAALVWSVNALQSDETIEDYLKRTAVDLGPAGYDTTYGYGLVNAEAAVISAGG